MDAVVKVTSQGQISIPAKLRRRLKLKTGDKVLVREAEHKLTVERVPDLVELGGVLRERALQGKTRDEVAELEATALAEGLAETEG
jgi:AbrB family looped-hinge helix DNA binding protein